MEIVKNNVKNVNNVKTGKNCQRISDDSITASSSNNNNNSNSSCNENNNFCFVPLCVSVSLRLLWHCYYGLCCFFFFGDMSYGISLKRR